MDLNKTVIAPTGAIASTPHGTWAFTGIGAITAGGYPAPQRLDGSSAAAQSAPLTIVTEPRYADGQSGPAPMAVTTTASPCRQGSQPQNRVYEVGGGVLI